MQFRGACGHDCPDTCAWVVDVRDGKAETLVGDPAHPFTRGTLCAKVNHYLERVYHPDRVLHPLKRIGAKGEARFARVSWEEALADIAARWNTITAESGAEAILPHSSAGVQGLIQMSSLDRRLFGSMGRRLRMTSNLMELPSKVTSIFEKRSFAEMRRSRELCSSDH